jgi:hypothetical protein
MPDAPTDLAPAPKPTHARTFRPGPVDLTAIAQALRFVYVIPAEAGGVIEVDAGDIEQVLVDLKQSLPTVFGPTGAMRPTEAGQETAGRPEIGFDLILDHFNGKLEKLPASIGDLKVFLFTVRRVLRVPESVSYLQGTLAVLEAFMLAAGKLEIVKKNITPPPGSPTSSPAPSTSTNSPTP